MWHFKHVFSKTEAEAAVALLRQRAKYGGHYKTAPLDHIGDFYETRRGAACTVYLCCLCETTRVTPAVLLT